MSLGLHDSMAGVGFGTGVLFVCHKTQSHYVLSQNEA